MTRKARLPAAEWTQRESLAALVRAIGAGNIRWVGGAVRDTLAGRPVADVDAATPLPPNEIMRRLKDAGIRSVPTGIEHGTVTAIFDDGNVEITTLRRDVSTDGRRATVEYSDDWREDAARRDFTINALYADPETLELHDYFGGLEDLETGRVRFIGDPRDRIREDHLRILRYYRFQTRYGSAPDPEAEEACAALAPTMKGLSRERVGWELQLLLSLPDPAPTVSRMHENGVLGEVLPETGAAGVKALAALVAGEQDQQVAGDPVRRLAALLPADPAAAAQVAARLRLSNAQKKRLVTSAGRKGEAADEAGDPRVLAYRLGRTGAIDRMLLSGSSIAPLDGWDIPELPLKGGEIVARGVDAGPEVARILRAVENRWLAEGFPGRSRVEEILAEELAKG
jgi:poly(A) polymerase